MVFGENGLWLARSRPPRKGHYRSPQVVKQAYRGGMELFYFWQRRSKGYERLAYSGSFANDELEPVPFVNGAVASSTGLI